MSAPPHAAELLRPGVLDGVRVLLASARAGVGAGPFATAAEDACTALGARTNFWSGDEPAPADVDVLVFDGAASFAAPRERAAASGSDAARAALRGCLDEAWVASHAVANAAFIDAGRSGRIVYVAPPSRADAAEHADAARAGLENLARTLSIEWARHGVSTVAIAPGASTADADVAVLCAYLASPAGAYFSGCLLDLRGGASATGA